jgi:hypothetical protein
LGLTSAAICGGGRRKSGEVAMAVRLRTPQRLDVEHGYLITIELSDLHDQVTRKKKKLLGSVPVGEIHSH